MKCATCHRPINSADAVRRAEYRQQRDGTVKVFGHGMPGGPLSAAAGQLVGAKHSGCYHADRKREQRAAS